MKTYNSELLGAKIDITNGRIYFFGGFLSQWADSIFYDETLDIHFVTAEQGMMAHKAITFNDNDMFRAIMTTENPSEQKHFGRLIRNYDDKIWNDVKFNIVRRLNLLKFQQNKAYRELLLLTIGNELVESSPYDKIWGVGLGADNPLIFDSSNWKGQNLLGKALMEVRGEIISEL